MFPLVLTCCLWVSSCLCLHLSISLLHVEKELTGSLAQQSSTFSTNVASVCQWETAEAKTRGGYFMLSTLLTSLKFYPSTALNTRADCTKWFPLSNQLNQGLEQQIFLCFPLKYMWVLIETQTQAKNIPESEMCHYRK